MGRSADPLPREGPREALHAALRLELQAVRLRRGDGALELALGETLRRLFDSGKLIELGYAKRQDYARESFGARWRSVLEWLQLAAGLQTRPVLRRAVVAGLVSPRKARRILDVAQGDAEAAWTHAAMVSTEAELGAAMASEGAAPPELPHDGEALVARMDAGQQERFDAALGMAERVEGPGKPRWIYLEAIAQEYLGSFGVADPVAEGLAAEDPAAAKSRAQDGPGLSALVARRLAAVDEAAALVQGLPETTGALPSDAFELHRRAVRLWRAKQGRDLALGAVLFDFVEAGAWKALGFGPLETWCRDRLETSARTVRHWVWMERAMRRLPPLRQALEAGRLTGAQAQVIARVATVLDVDQLIEQAASTTTRQTLDEADDEQRRQNRARGIERVWGPADAMAVVRDAMACAQARARGTDGPIPAGEALARVADHFVAVYALHRPPRWSRRRAEVIGRQRGRCAVPGCSHPVQHLHHIRYRSRGGGNETDNLVGLCWRHHLVGIHRGHLKVSGRGGMRLRWEFTGRDGEDATWITRGGRDERRRARQGDRRHGSRQRAERRPMQQTRKV